MSYVQLTRDEFEDWLDSLGFRGQWKIKPGRGGVYQIFLSPTVMIEINSTTGSQGAVRDKGKASMSLRLVSRVTGKTLNKKAMGQRYFARTTNWRKNWAKGVDRMQSTYDSSKGWYDQIARIADRDAYQRDMVQKIEDMPGWDQDAFLQSLHERLSKGGVLTVKQEQALTNRRERPSRPERQSPPPPASNTQEVERLRELYRRARASRDDWTMDFTTSVAKLLKAGRPLSPRQQQILNDKLDRYRLSEGRRAAQNFYSPSDAEEVENWVEDFGMVNNYTPGTCDLNRGDCDMMSNVFADWFEDETGAPLDLYAGAGFIPPLGQDANDLWIMMSGDEAHERGEKPLQHVVARWGDWIIDLTGRQFGSKYKAPVYPFSEFKQRWAEVRKTKRADRQLNKLRRMMLQNSSDW